MLTSPAEVCLSLSHIKIIDTELEKLSMVSRRPPPLYFFLLERVLKKDPGENT